MIISALIFLLLFRFHVSGADGEGGVCRSVYNTSSGYIQTVNYPDPYDDYSECEYYIRPVLNAYHILKLVPVDFDLEGGYDMLEVREVGPHGNFLGHFTGTIMPILYGKAFWMRFTSDFSNSKKGFKISWTVVSEGVRLVNGTGGMEGRVEIFHGGQWGTICDDSWEPSEAYITCKMMGFIDPKAKHFSQAHFGRGVDPIWLDNTKCQLNMSSLSQCRVDGWGTHNCNHGEDSGARCTEAADTLKRLVREKSSFPKGCSSLFTKATGSLGSPQFPLYPNYAQCHYTIKPPEPTLNLIQLTFSIFDLQDRSEGSEGSDFLEIREDGPNGVFLGRFTGNRLPPVIYAKSLWLSFTSDASKGRQGFQATWESSTTGVRLRNGTVLNEGRVEIFQQGKWGTVCDDSWDVNEATVICAMLGYSDNDTIIGKALKGGTFGPGVGEVHLDDMSCTGMEDNIHECSSGSSHNCNHFEDAGVRCNSKTYASPTLNSNDSSIQKDIADAVSLSCDSRNMTVTVNLTQIVDTYPGLMSNSIYLTLSTENCVGQRDDDVIVFKNDITDCGMTATETRNSVIYRNRLVSHDNNTVPANETVGQLAVIVPLECSLAKSVQVSIPISVYKKKKKGKTVRGYGNFTAELNLFKDPGFSQKVLDYPLYVEKGEEMYVETRILTSDKNLKLVLYDCVATPDPNSTQAASYPLISNRCTKDRYTRLLPTPSNSTNRFLFKAFQFLQKEGVAFIKCSLIVCNVTDSSSRCSRACQTNGRSRRSQEDGKRIVQVMQGPIILKSTHDSVSISHKNIHLGGIIAICAVLALIVLVVVLAVYARKKKKTQTWFVNRVYDEYDNHTDQTMMIPMESNPGITE